MTQFTAKEPSRDLLAKFLTPSLFSTRGYHIDAPSTGIKLDQNESPWDWPSDVKDAVLKRLHSMQWNRYPTPFADEVVAKIAQRIGIKPECVLLGPGSNYLLALILQTFSKKITGKMVLTRPSFALYETHCQYEGIPYETWDLNQDLEYDLKTLPPLPPGSMVVFASPNNPVGNILSKETFKKLLSQYPEVVWIADEAYAEFYDETYLDLLKEHDNIILVRTFSKTLGAAGVRLGYIVAGANVIDLLKKPRVPFLINQFSLAAVHEVFENPSMAKIFDDIIKNALSERERVFTQLTALSKKHSFKVKQSFANFLLVKWSSTEESNRVYQSLIDHGILVRNVSKGPGLAGCLRISIGTTTENDQLIKFFLQM